MFDWMRKIFGSSEVAPLPPTFPEERDQVELIEVCRSQFGNPPRQLSAANQQACKLTLTPDMQQMFEEIKDPLLRILADQDKLRDRGEIVWGHLVQANSMIFDPANKYTLPANVVYSMDHYFDGRVIHLGQLARGLFAQKGSVPADRKLREFVRVIIDERERILRRELPWGYCGGHSVYFTTCFIQPSHLPGGYLCGSSFPLLVNFRETEAVMILPSQFWPYAMVRQWTS